MEKIFELKEMWFNNTDKEVVLSGILHKDFLQYDTKVRLSIQRLNALINILQKKNENFDLYDHMCCFNLGFITEYNVVLPATLDRNFTQVELMGEEQAPLKQIRA
ncbi:MAG: hypothetical protein NWR96_05760 [Crocinitomicaceae bacterium]|jgi:hypothetical protein|nr:hypothetical protein [Crocinitomicaceae bacterium]